METGTGNRLTPERELTPDELKNFNESLTDVYGGVHDRSELYLSDSDFALHTIIDHDSFVIKHVLKDYKWISILDEIFLNSLDESFFNEWFKPGIVPMNRVYHVQDSVYIDKLQRMYGYIKDGTYHTDNPPEFTYIPSLGIYVSGDGNHRTVMHRVMGYTELQGSVITLSSDVDLFMKSISKPYLHLDNC